VLALREVGVYVEDVEAAQFFSRVAEQSEPRMVGINGGAIGGDNKDGVRRLLKKRTKPALTRVKCFRWCALRHHPLPSRTAQPMACGAPVRARSSCCGCAVGRPPPPVTSSTRRSVNSRSLNDSSQMDSCGELRGHRAHVCPFCRTQMVRTRHTVASRGSIFAGLPPATAPEQRCVVVLQRRCVYPVSARSQVYRLAAR